MIYCANLLRFPYRKNCGRRNNLWPICGGFLRADAAKSIGRSMRSSRTKDPCGYHDCALEMANDKIAK